LPCIFNFHYLHQWLTQLFGAQLRFLGLSVNMFNIETLNLKTSVEHGFN
jgi:hypothetical protein